MPRPSRGALRALFLGVVVVAVPACSTRKLVYQYGETLLVREIDRSLDLRDSQRDWVRQRLRGHFAWHRKAELPYYAERIEQLRGLVADGISPQDLKWTRQAMEELWRRLASRLAPDAGALLAGLSPAQIDHLEESMGERRKGRRELLDLPVEQYVAKRSAEVKKSLRRWVGPLEPAQESLIESYVRKNRDDVLVRRQSDRAGGKDLLALLRRRPGAQEIVDQLLARLTTNAVGEPPEIQAAGARLEAALVELALALDRSATTAQRRHLDTELVAWRDDFLSLAKDQKD